MTNPERPERDAVDARTRPLVVIIMLTALLLLLMSLVAVGEWLLPAGDDAQMRRALTLREHVPQDNILPLSFTDRSVHPEGRSTVRFQVGPGRYVEPSGTLPDPDLKIVFLGGSTTENKHAAELERWPYRVGRILDERLDIAVDTWNSGVSGNDSMHSNLILLGKIVPLQPDMVVLMHDINDVVPLLYFDTYWNDSDRGLVHFEELPGFTDALAWRVQNLLPDTYRALSVLKRKLSKSEESFAASRRIGDPQRFDAYRQMFRRSLHTFVSTARIWDIEPVLMTQPGRFKGDDLEALRAEAHRLGVDPDQMATLFHLFNDDIRNLARHYEVPLIDLAETFEAGPETMYDFVHYNDRGSHMIADLVADGLEGIIRSERGTGPENGGDPSASRDRS